MEYGLIGSKLGHSYSKIIHEMLCGYHYDLCPLPTEEEARAFLTRRQFKAINVTIPYKRLVMEYCTYIDPRAKAIVKQHADIATKQFRSMAHAYVLYYFVLMTTKLVKIAIDFG